MARSLRNMMGAGMGALSASMLNGTVADGLTASGSSQFDAMRLQGDCNVLTNVPAGSGVMLPPNPQPGDEIVITNLGANTLLVYPYLGASMQGGADNVPYTLVAGASASFIARKGSMSWIALASAGNVVVAPAINAPVLTRTSTGGTPPFAFDETIDATAYAGFRRRLQVASDSGFTTIVQDLYKSILEDEINGSSADWSTSAFNPPRDYSTDVITGLTITWPGTRYFRERIERDDGTNSAWSNTITDTYSSVALVTVNGTGKHSNVTVSGTPVLNFSSASFDGNHQLVKADTNKTGGQRQWEVTITANGGGPSQIGFGVDDGSTNFGQTSSPRPGDANVSGFTYVAWSTGFQVYQGGGGTVVVSGSAGAADGFANGDVYTVRQDDVANTADIYRTRSGVERLMASLTGMTQSAMIPFAGGDQNGITGTVNFGGSPFTKALSGSYVGYQS